MHVLKPQVKCLCLLDISPNSNYISLCVMKMIFKLFDSDHYAKIGPNVTGTNEDLVLWLYKVE